jgi:hypothetical protein
LLTVTSSHTIAHSQSLLLLLPFAINMATRCYRALLLSALRLHNTVPLVFLFYPPFFHLSFRRHGAFRDSTPHASFLPPSPTRSPFSSYSAPSTYHPSSPPLGILSLLIPSILCRLPVLRRAFLPPSHPFLLLLSPFPYLASIRP